MNLREKVEALAEALGPSEQTERSVTNNVDLPDSQIKKSLPWQATSLPISIGLHVHACKKKRNRIQI